MTGNEVKVKGFTRVGNVINQALCFVLQSLITAHNKVACTLRLSSFSNHNMMKIRFFHTPSDCASTCNSECDEMGINSQVKGKERGVMTRKAMPSSIREFLNYNTAFRRQSEHNEYAEDSSNADILSILDDCAEIKKAKGDLRDNSLCTEATALYDSDEESSVTESIVKVSFVANMCHSSKDYSVQTNTCHLHKKSSSIIMDQSPHGASMYLEFNTCPCAPPTTLKAKVSRNILEHMPDRLPLL
jgi:hypothetical protein